MIWLPSEVGLELVVDDRHRHDRLDGPQPAQRLGARHQPAAEAAGDGGEDDVVDGAAVHLADRAVVGELGAHGDEPALLREPAVHRRGVHRAAAGEGVGHLGDPGAGGRGRRPSDSALARVVIQSVRGLSRLSVTALSAAADRARPDGRGRQSSSCPRVDRSGEVSSSTWPMSTVSRPSTRIWWLLVSSAMRPCRGPRRSSTPTADGCGRAGATRCARRARAAGPSMPGRGSAERRTW